MQKHEYPERKVIFFILLFTFLSYLSSLFAGFVFDDRHMIVYNVYIRSFHYVPQFFAGKVTSYLSHNTMYRPLLMLTFIINYYISALNPWSYHLFNVLIHIANVYLVFRLLSLIFPSASFYLRAAVVFVFAVHPVNTEAVIYVSSRSDLLSTFFILLGLVTYMERKYLYAFLCHILAFLTKETAVVFFPLLIAIEAFGVSGERNSAEDTRKRNLSLILIFLATLFFIYLRYHLYGTIGGKVSLASHISNVLLQARVSFFYLRLFIFPYPLCADWPFYRSMSVYLPDLISLAAVVLLLVIALPARRRYKYIGFAVFFYFISLAPKFYAVLNFPACEHHFYFPSIALYIILIYLLKRFPWEKVKYFFWMVIPVFAVLTFLRGFDYKDDARFWESNLQVNKNSAVAYYNIAYYLFDKGEYSLAGDMMEKALQLSKREVLRESIFHALSIIYLREKNYRKAEGLLRFVLKKYPRTVQFWQVKGQLALALNKNKEAEEALKKALMLAPNDAETETMLGYFYLRVKKLDLAKEYLEKAITHNRFFARAYMYMGFLYSMKGETKLAARFFRQAHQYGLDEFTILFEFGTFCAQLGDYQDAVENLEMAFSLNPNSAKCAYNLAVSYLHLRPLNKEKARFYMNKSRILGYPIVPEEEGSPRKRQPRLKTPPQNTD